MVTIDLAGLPDQARAAVQRAFLGEEVTLLLDGVTVAKIEPVPTPSAGRRVFGLHRGKTQLPDDFNTPLPDEFWTGGNP